MKFSEDDKHGHARKILALMRRLRTNRHGIYVALAIVVICATGIGLDALWGQQQSEVAVRWGALLGLVVVAATGLWFAVRLSRENEQLVSQIKELAQQLEGEAFQADEDEQAALASTFKFNERLSLALVAVGFLGGITMAGTMLTSVDRIFENPLGALGVLAVALLCMGMALWWVLRNRKLIKQMRELSSVEEDCQGDVIKKGDED